MNIKYTADQIKQPDLNRVVQLFDFYQHEKEAKNRFISAGHKIIGETFEVKKENADIITNLLKYFTGNDGEYNLNRGIYLHGPFGVGKTVMMEVFRRFLADNFWMSPNGFHSTSLEQIIERYKSDNNLDYYGYNRDSNPFNLCINEFGKPLNEKIYGTEVDRLIESLFMTRYELFQNRKAITHITSNFSPANVKMPGIIKDRMNEMFNFIEIKGISLRTI